MAASFREPVEILEIDQPQCALTYGVAPCTARVGATGSQKCYNTPATCQSLPNISLTAVVTWRFSEPQRGIEQYDNVIPSITTKISTTAGEINLGGMDARMSPLGQREVVRIQLDDHLFGDTIGDKYLSERGFVGGHRLTRSSRYRTRSFRRPGGAEKVARRGFFGGYQVDQLPQNRGTMWGKFVARNPFYSAFSARVLSGLMGDALADMTKRYYLVDRVEGPSQGRVKISLKDLFAKVDARKAVAPLVSQGALLADITAIATSATLSPTGVGNAQYPASGRVRIKSELIDFTRVGDVLTLTRARGETVAEAHKADDLVQIVLQYTAQLARQILYDQFVTYAGVAPSAIPLVDWTALDSVLPELYTFDVTEPTPCEDIIGELAQVGAFTVWPEVSSGLVRLRALRASAASPIVDDAGWILDGSIDVRRQDGKRVSSVWVYFGQIDATKDVDERTNYHSVAISADTDAPGLYGSSIVYEVFARGIPVGGRNRALECGQRLLAMFRDPPLEAEFSIDAGRDGELELARLFQLKTAEVQDANGDQELSTVAPVLIERNLNEQRIVAQGVTFTGTAVSTARTIYVENDLLNINLRSLHDALYAAPVAGNTVTFMFVPGFVVGSASTGLYSVRTGTWPAGVVPNLVFQGRIEGKGGRGGRGGDSTTGYVGADGATGGDAILIESPVTIDNAAGVIDAGGGGGGGGGKGDTGGGAGFNGGGSAGGGGAGTNAGEAGAPGDDGLVVTGNPAGAATADAGGSGGASTGIYGGGAGGNGGAPGQPGTAGSTGTGVFVFPGGAPGAAGRAVVGDSLVTWIALGTIHGARVG